MAKKPLRIIAVGNLKTSHWKQASIHYAQRIQHWRLLQEIIVKDADSSLSISDRNAMEGQRLLNSVQDSDVLICLDERGKNFTSPDFAKFLQSISENATRIPCFMIGGAFGLDDKVKEKAKYKLALGTMTFPHELARVLLLEQIYRAEAIIRGVPYHH